MGKTSNINGWERFLNFRVKLVFDDGSKITIKFGNLTSVSDDFLFILTSEGEEGINKDKVVRIEKC